MKSVLKSVLKYIAVAVISLLVGFVAGNLIYPGADGKVILAMASIIFVVASGAATKKEA